MPRPKKEKLIYDPDLLDRHRARYQPPGIWVSPKLLLPEVDLEVVVLLKMFDGENEVCLGKFWGAKKGISGWWTHYGLTHTDRIEVLGWYPIPVARHMEAQ